MAAPIASFAGKRVLVTGGASGIGRAIVDRMIADKAHVIALDKNEGSLKKLQETSPSVQTVACDVQNWNETKKLVQSIGPVEHLVNNAGIFSFVPFMQIEEEDFDRLYSINLKSVISISQAVAANMMDNNIKGSIVNVSSLSSQLATMGLALYGSSKGALSNLTKVMAVELGIGGIRVNAVCPAFVDTHMTHSTLNEEQIKKILKRSINRRLIKPQEVADLTAFLLSPNAAMINGQSVFIDGGFSVM